MKKGYRVSAAVTGRAGWGWVVGEYSTFAEAIRRALEIQRQAPSGVEAIRATGPQGEPMGYWGVNRAENKGAL